MAISDRMIYNAYIYISVWLVTTTVGSPPSRGRPRRLPSRLSGREAGQARRGGSLPGGSDCAAGGEEAGVATGPAGDHESR
jgi:hypothetical protein